MNRSELDKYYAENVGLVHAVARKGHARLLSIGAAMPYEDVAQEMSIVFIKAFDGYSPELGNKFSSYFTRAAYNHLNEIVKGYSDERVKYGVRSVEEMSEHIKSNEGIDVDVGGYIVCNRNTPERDAMQNEAFAAVFSGLSPIAAQIVSWLIDPPELVEEELSARIAHAEFARSHGVPKRASDSLSLGFVCDVLLKTGVSNQAIRQARRELEKAVSKEMK